MHGGGRAPGGAGGLAMYCTPAMYTPSQATPLEPQQSLAGSRGMESMAARRWPLSVIVDHLGFYN